jgi:hypothetical protein
MRLKDSVRDEDGSARGSVLGAARDLEYEIAITKGTTRHFVALFPSHGKRTRIALLNVGEVSAPNDRDLLGLLTV